MHEHGQEMMGHALPVKRLPEDGAIDNDGDLVASESPVEECAENAIGDIRLPRRRFFRQRAHCNPFSDHDLD